MIRIDPTRLGPLLGELRATRGISRRGLARTVANQTLRDAGSVNAQIWRWDEGHTVPGLASLPPVLAALGYDLALIPREDA